MVNLLQGHPGRVSTSSRGPLSSLFCPFLIYNARVLGLRLCLSLSLQIMLTIDHERKGWVMLEKMKPDVLHVTSPGFLILPCLAYARIYRIPLLISYHTHLPLYARSYLGWIPGIEALSWLALRFAHNKADLTLCTSPQMQQEMKENGVERVDVWRKGIDTEVGGPCYCHDVGCCCS